jgi:hypothetical protein
MTPRKTALLALLVAVVGGYVWFEEVPSPEPPRAPDLLGEPRVVAPTETVKRFFNLVPADVTAIQVQYRGERRSAKRVGTTWEGVVPPGAIDDFLNTIDTLGIVMEISEEPKDFVEFGLQPPTSVVALFVERSKEPLLLVLGDRNPATTGVYVRIGEHGPVVLAGALLAWEVEKAFRALPVGPPSSP